MSKFIDLTHTFTDHMPVYPGDPCSRLYQSAWIKDGGPADHRIESCMHVGTHIDAPVHMIEGAATIDEFPIEKFQARGVLVDARCHTLLQPDILNTQTIHAGDAVLIYTGWDKKFRTDEYFASWPYFSPAFANRLVELGISLVGMDTAGPDIEEPFEAHKILLPSDILIIENLANLDELLEIKDFTFHAYPAKYQADAAPVRAFAEIA